MTRMSEPARPPLAPRVYQLIVGCGLHVERYNVYRPESVLDLFG